MWIYPKTVEATSPKQVMPGNAEPTFLRNPVTKINPSVGRGIALRCPGSPALRRYLDSRPFVSISG